MLETQKASSETKNFIDELEINDDFFSKPENIDEIIKLLNSDHADPGTIQKINEGLLILKIVATNFKENRDEIFFINLIDKIQLQDQEQLSGFFEKLPDALKNQASKELLDTVLEKFQKVKANFQKMVDSITLKKTESSESEASRPLDIDFDQLIKIYSKLFFSKNQDERNQIFDSIDPENKKDFLAKILFISAFNNHHEIFNLLIDKATPEEQFILVTKYIDHNEKNIFVTTCDNKCIMIVKKLCANFESEKILEILEEKTEKHSQFSLINLYSNANIDLITTLLEKLNQEQTYNLLFSDYSADLKVFSLSIMAKNNSADVIKLCFDKIDDEEKIFSILILKNDENDNVIQFALRNQNNIEIVKSLLEKINDESKIEALLINKNKHQLNALHYCSTYEASDIEEILMSKLQPEQIIRLLNCLYYQGYSPLDCAIMRGCVDLFEVFIKKLSGEQIIELLDKIKISLSELDSNVLSNHEVENFFKSSSSENLEKIKEILKSKNLKLDADFIIVSNQATITESEQGSPSPEPKRAKIQTETKVGNQQ